MSKAILEIELPDSCLACSLSDYESGEDGEDLFCIPLSSTVGDPVEGDYQKRRIDCPLKIQDNEEITEKRQKAHTELARL